MNKLNEEYLKNLIADVEYIKIGKKTTVCCLTMKSGFEVIGISACVDVNNYIKEIGEDLAYKNAFEKIWELEGYLLQNKLI